MPLLDDYPLRLLIDREDCSQLIGEGLTFSNVDPGGYEAASIPIPRDMPQSIVGQRVRIESGLGVAWEGRIGQIQRSLGARTVISCEGYGALLKEPNLAMIFVDRDFASWTGPTVAFALVLRATGSNPIDPSTQPDPISGENSLVTQIEGSWASKKQLALAIYDAHGMPIADIAYAWKIDPATINAADVNWQWYVKALTDPDSGIVSSSANLRAAGPGLGMFSPAPGVNYTAASVELQYASWPAGSDGTTYPLYWTCLAVYGGHGLTKRGSQTATTAPGFYTSDIAGWVVDQIAQLQRGIFPDATGYIVPHSAYLQGTAGEGIIDDMAKFIGQHWGVWEALSLTGDSRPRVDFRPYPTSYTASCGRRDFDELDLNEQLASLYDTAVVSYTDVVGVSRSVTVTAPNPRLVAAGITGRTIPLTGGTMDAPAARTFGQIVLALLYQQARVAGSGTMLGTVRRISDPAGNSMPGEIPSYMLKAGLDRLRITDLPGPIDAWGSESEAPLSRVEASIGADGIRTTVELGTGANLIETLQAQLAAAAGILGF